MKRLTAVLASALFAACGATDTEDFRSASPSRQGIDIKTPSSSAQALTSAEVVSRQEALGQLAHWYLTTRDTTVRVNTATAAVLNLCEDIVKFEPTSVSGNQAVWGPHTNPLSPNTLKFTVTKNSDGTYDYVLEGKPKTSDDSAYLKLIVGHHEPGSAKNVGKGTFTIDWDAVHTLDPLEANTGSAVFTYERNSHLDVSVGVSFRDTAGQSTAAYKFSQIAGGDGTFEFAILSDWTALPANTQAIERFSIKSRWTNAGAGRADLRASGGDLAQEVTASECWSTAFLRVYFTDSLGFTQTEGSEADCAFSPASYSDIQ